MLRSRPLGPFVTVAARRSAVVASWTLISRATGLGRVVVIGAVLGPTFFANTFIATNVVPNIVFSAVAGQALGLVVVPAVVSASSRGPRGHAAELLGGVGACLLTAAGAVTALLILASPLLGWSLTFGIDDPVVRQQAQRIAVLMILLVSPQVVLYTLAALAAAAQQARERFVLAAAAPAVENVILIVIVVVAGVTWGTGQEVGGVPHGFLLTLGVGSTAAVAVHTGLQLYGAARCGLPVRPFRRWWREPGALRVARRLRGSLAVPAAPMIGMYALLIVAATVPGGVVVVQLAYAIFQFPIALGARAVSIAVLPDMSGSYERGDRAAFAASWRQALTYATVTGLPAAVLLLVLGESVAHVLASGEMRSPDVIARFTACITVVAVAQLAAGMHQIGRQGLFARIDVAGPRNASLALLIVTVTIAALALLVAPGTMRLVILCVALLLGELAGAVITLVRLWHTIRPERFADPAHIAVTVIATAAMLPVVGVGWWLLDTNELGTVAEFGVLVACGLLSLAAFTGAARARLLHLSGGAT